MLKNYLKIAFRNLLRHRAFSVINIAGLAMGIASCLLLFTVVKYELSYDKFQPNYKQIYHVVTKNGFEGGITYNAGVPFPALDALRLKFPQITTGALLASYESQVTVLGKNASNTSSDKKFIEETGFFFADPQFFKVFHYDFLIGSPDVLSEPNKTVLTQKIANKYFGNWENAMGKQLLLDNNMTVVVSGILKDPPANTDYPLGIVTSFETARAAGGNYYNTEWGSTTSNFQVFMLIPENISAASIDKQLLAFSKEKYTSKTRPKINFLQPLKEVHFDSNISTLGDHITNKSTLWTLSLIGLFIIVMACINFINLSTAQAIGRSKEIGIRKVLGSNRKQLFAQIIGETSIIVTIAVVLALIIATLCIPLIKHVAFIQQAINFFNWPSILFLIALSIAIILFAGSYPAFILSGFRPALALKNKITSATLGGISIRRSLVVAQFAISQILIIGTIVAVTQMSFIKNADLGYSKEAVLLMSANADSAMHAKQELFKRKLLQAPGVQSVSFTSDAPSSDNNMDGNFAYDHRPDENFQVSFKLADEDYFKTFGLEFIAGKAFDKSDTMKQLVVNQTLLSQLGVKNPQDAISKGIRIGGGNWNTIVGVVKDFKTSSLRDAVRPIVIAEHRVTYGLAAIKINSANIPKTKAAVESAWNQFFPEYAYTSSYMDENIAKFYQQEDQLSLLYKIFAGIAIFISCLGLYGLVSFMAVQKTKEIGVRKVLGASVKNIIFLFSKEFTLLVGIGSLIAIPVAYFMMNNWLQNFEFRIKMNAGIFIIAILISIIIAWITVGYKSIKAAIANPVKSLRTE